MKNKIISFLLAFLAAFSLWIYVMTVENPQDTKMIYNIPVVFSGLEDMRADRNLLITDGLDSTVNIEISGKRSVIQKIEADSVEAVVDVSRLKSVGQFNMIYNLVFRDGIDESELVVTEKNPYQIPFTVEPQIKKVIEVKGLLDGEVAEGYLAEPMEFEPEELAIYGPANAVNPVQYAQVILSRTNLDKTVTTSLPYQLIDGDGNVVPASDIQSDITEIAVTQPVSKIKELPLVVEYIPGGGATAENVSTTITPGTITVSGDAVMVDSINQIVLDNIDLAEIYGDTTLEYRIPLPDNLINISGVDVATVDVNIRGLGTSKIRTTNIGVVNVPDGYTATLMTQMVQVTLRGPESVMSEIEAQNIRVVVDLEGWTTGEYYSASPKIHVDGFDNVGILDDYLPVVVAVKSIEEISTPAPEEILE